ncbi:MAG: ligase-associated DNA damage response exonuclease [Bacteroidia bacterium]
MPKEKLLTFTDRGIYCLRANLYLDPWKPVDKAIVTHGHSDHARPGSRHYIAQHDSVPILKLRLGDSPVTGIGYGEPFSINGVTFSLHPAGHIIGSAQVRVEYKGEIWVFTGDYKTENDNLCTPYESIKCNVFISESTFALPVYRWRPQAEVFAEINSWWRRNAEAGKTSLLLGYTLGKAQRLFHNVDPSIGRIFGHGAICNMHEVLRTHGIPLRPLERITSETDRRLFPGSLVIAPPSALSSPWVRKFYPFATGTASGWMQVRGARRRRAVDRGFVLSDHADWPGLLAAIRDTGAERVFLTHGYSAVLARYLSEQGLDASVVETEYKGEMDEETDTQDLPEKS